MFRLILLLVLCFTVAGWMYGGDNVDLNRVEFFKKKALFKSNFDIKIWMLVPAVIVIVLLALKRPSMPTIAMGALIGAIWATLFPRNELLEMPLEQRIMDFSIQSGV